MSDNRSAARTEAEQSQRLADLRAQLSKHSLDGFLVPLADEHQGEYIPARAQRLAWLTGFTGSAGIAIVLPDRAAVFSDGRYTLQLREQIDTTLFEPLQTPDSRPAQWLSKQIQAGQRVGYDPWLHTPAGLKPIRESVTAPGGQLVACAENPIDQIWSDQPAPPQAAVFVHPLEFAGTESTAKREEIAAALRDEGLDAAVLTLPDSIAWLLNIRGADVPRTPLALSFALIDRNAKVDWFIDLAKVGPEVLRHVGNEVSVASIDQLGPALDQLGTDGQSIALDSDSASAWLADRLDQAGAKRTNRADPCLLPKACKNTVELAGMRRAHERDGLAVTRFLHWLATNATDGQIDELGAERKLELLRREHDHFRDLSFDTITGAGANGAIVHYRVSEKSNRKLTPGSLYLVDSGAQYPDGTTDITRTIAIGTPSAEQRDRFTRVLQGHIALATAKFPVGTTGSQLDVLARMALWQAGLDYDHGTGHGVGSYLSVHEGPQRISKMASGIALRPGMVISNEPGYYKAGHYGIRIENLVAVTEAKNLPNGERPMLGFETLTIAPIDLNLVVTELLSANERDWLNQYHAWIAETLSPKLNGPVRDWLLQIATRPI